VKAEGLAPHAERKSIWPEPIGCGVERDARDPDSIIVHGVGDTEPLACSTGGLVDDKHFEIPRRRVHTHLGDERHSYQH